MPRSRSPSASPLATLLLLLLLLLHAPPTAAAKNRTADLFTCLRDSMFTLGSISTPGSPDFSIALSQSLIQDPLAEPQIFVRPNTTAAVSRAVKCANRVGSQFCARSGGHSWSSASICPGMVIDMQRMTALKTTNNKNYVRIAAGKTIGETLYQLYTTARRIIPIGACPSVGVAGYVQGGGFGTLSGKLGLLSDNVRALTVVTPSGNVLRATPKHNKHIFWGLTGGGGGYLGVVTEIGLMTHDPVGTYDNNVYFSFAWDTANSAEALYQWTKYPLSDDGSLYIRMVTNVNPAGRFVRGVGVCWMVMTKKECNAKLQALALWSVPGRSMILMHKSRQGVLEAQKFFTIDAKYAEMKPMGPRTTKSTFTKRFDTKASLADRSWSSIMWSDPMSRADTNYFEQLLNTMVNLRATRNLRSIGTEFYPLGKKARSLPSSHSAFPHRDATAVLSVFYNGGAVKMRRKSKQKIQTFLGRFSTGTYVNYQDLDMSRSEYTKAYWGANLKRMKNLKKQLDPHNKMWHPQPL